MKYPGRIIKAGEPDSATVRVLKERLNELLADPSLRLDTSNETFGVKMRQAVKLFQARNVDDQGRPLKQDGEVGALTWAAMFGATSVPVIAAADGPFLDEVLRIAGAAADKPVREVPRNSNRGPDVDVYLDRLGVSRGLAWCCAFVYFCFDEAAARVGRTNPMVRTAGCLDHWRKAPAHGATVIPASSAVADPARLRPGAVFIMDHGGGLGHTGFIERVEGGLMATIEGNTDASKTREGGGVYRLQRKINEVNRGFIEYPA